MGASKGKPPNALRAKGVEKEEDILIIAKCCMQTVPNINVRGCIQKFSDWVITK